LSLVQSKLNSQPPHCVPIQFAAKRAQKCTRQLAGELATATVHVGVVAAAASHSMALL
jgi:hypothetical protein